MGGARQPGAAALSFEAAVGCAPRGRVQRAEQGGQREGGPPSVDGMGGRPIMAHEQGNGARRFEHWLKKW
ncbi:MAG: hypothetical protein WD403_04065, partial [Pirellulales bacterium]